MACWEMANGSARAETVAGPWVRRCKIARRVGSERAAKACVKLSTTIWLCIVELEVKKISCPRGSMRFRMKRCRGVRKRPQAGGPVLLVANGSECLRYCGLAILCHSQISAVLQVTPDKSAGTKSPAATKASLRG